ncbi:MAG TPA: helix-turn-helix domain-containing protein [Vitreimonas sp.]|uniref:helix-turn-helix domain-containing protein n=1 Tax=Vitreimonas sp. TaxID=3069702 RepID=UPI002D697E31|nr:helix-turn-helix domain-containing protein [Vitreimonas sp.]HYD89090.1 helix-turn-helix domain-containing protein [Vitreimonas sp.]
MSKAGQKVLRGLREAAAHARGEPSKVIVHAPAKVNVKAIRARTGLSQDAFAKRYGFTLDSIQNWESNRREPTGAARLLLTVIDREPEAVERALHQRK